MCAGDWAAVGQLLASQGMGGYYDIILTAETIYNEDSQQRLLDCIKQVGDVHCVMHCVVQLRFGGAVPVDFDQIAVSMPCCCGLNIATMAV